MKVNRYLAVGLGIVILQVATVLSIRHFRTSTTPLEYEPWKIAGNPHGKVFLVEFSDFVCPHCYELQPVLKRLLAEYPDLYVIYKDFPVLGDLSELGAEAAECAGDQGKFWEYADLLYANREKWYTNVNNDPHRNIGPPLLQFAEEIHLDTEKFKPCLKNRVKTAVVKANMEEGNAWLVDSTPTVLLNGKKIMASNHYDYLKSQIDKELAKSK